MEQEWMVDLKAQAEAMKGDLLALQAYFDGTEVQTVLLEAGEELPLPSLTLSFPQAQGLAERILSVTCLPFTQGEVTACRMLQIYSEMRYPQTEKTKSASGYLCNRMNQTAPVGQFVVMDSDNDARIGYRYTWLYPKKSDIDGDAFMDVLMLALLAMEMMEGVGGILDALEQEPQAEDVDRAIQAIETALQQEAEKK